MTKNRSLLILLTAIAGVMMTIAADRMQCDIGNEDHRLDCFPQAGADESSCRARGCCWRPAREAASWEQDAVPWCHFPANYPGYEVKHYSHDDERRIFRARIVKRQRTNYPPLQELSLEVELTLQTQSRLRLRIVNSSQKQRFRVPVQLDDNFEDTSEEQRDYSVDMAKSGPFYVRVTRKTDGVVMFQSWGPLIYSDQFIQLSTLLPSAFGYGIGEQNRALLHDMRSQWTRIGLWNRDQPVDVNTNQYGTHPVYMVMPRSSGAAYALYFHNSNAQEFALQPAPALTYRTIGGIIDMYVLSGGGNGPQEAIRQYVSLVGRPALPAFWTLGFHLSRYGFWSDKDIRDTVKRNLKAKIPIDVLWTDIDYMDNFKDFTINQNSFSGLPALVGELKKNHGIKYVTIVDPGIKIQKKGLYPTFDRGLKAGVFIRNGYNEELHEGTVWPKITAFPDFSHPNATEWWRQEIEKFSKSQNMELDGIWIDMNEPANMDGGKFINRCVLGNSLLDSPPFVPRIRDGSLVSGTLCPSARHYNNVPHYDLHNLYSLMEARATHSALSTMRPNSRPFVLSRSTFAGSGRYAAHWTGDNRATWEQMAHSIRQVINFNLYGIPLVGADICGFNDQAEERMCVRWMQLGALLPFMRNHNSIGQRSQDPASWSKKAQDSMKESIELRYSLSAYMYSLMVRAHLYAEPVVRAMGWEFPKDTETHTLEHQFMLGPVLMVMPELEPGEPGPVVYFPTGHWYDLSSGMLLHHSRGIPGNRVHLASQESVRVAVRAGHILPLLAPGKSLLATRAQGSLHLQVALHQFQDTNASSQGELFWDDGESADSYTNGRNSQIEFSASSGSPTDGGYLNILPHKLGYRVDLPQLHSIEVLGLSDANFPSRVLVNNQPIVYFCPPKDKGTSQTHFSYFCHETTNKALRIQLFVPLKLTSSHKIRWF